jgi:4-hydroxybenzoate polyprenyltransferase/phosphoserine phosphatase
MEGQDPTQSASPRTGPLAEAIPLFVDLDGTLISSDVLVESAIGLLRMHPASLFSILGWLLQGRPTLKLRLAERAMPDIAALPYRESVLQILREQRDQGRRIYLATAADRLIAEAVGRHLDLFDGVIATDRSDNCKGAAKLQAIRQIVGQEPFAYMGDASADLPIWAKAQEAIVVSASRELQKRAAAGGAKVQAIDGGKGQLLPLLEAMRPMQWVKNLLLFTPMLAGHLVTTANVLVVLMGFVCFCLAASSIYLVNDVLDMHADRRHRTKCRRPIASGRLRIFTALGVWPILLVASLVLSLAVMPGVFTSMLLAYLATTLLYSLEFRQRLLLDVVVLAGLYTLRIFAGAVVILILPSFWLLAMSGLLFLSLAFLKRYVELCTMGPQETDEPANSRRYIYRDREAIGSIGIASGFASAIVLCLYVHSDNVTVLYSDPTMLWPIVPLFLYWISRIWIIAGRGRMADDPVAWTITDRVSWIVGLLAVLLTMLAAR